jgi:hypothetical protein
MSQRIDTKTGVPTKEPGSIDPTWLLSLGALAMMLEGCRVVGDIFRAGVFVGIAAVILCVAVVIGAIRLFTS